MCYDRSEKTRVSPLAHSYRANAGHRRVGTYGSERISTAVYTIMSDPDGKNGESTIVADPRESLDGKEDLL